MRYPMITGHTGNDETPSNSLESLKRSLSLGADAVEVDIRRDGDSVLVLSHDAKSKSAYDTCPRLTEALEIAARHPEICINCDLKEDELPLEVIALAGSFGIGANRLILSGNVTPAFLARHPEIVEMADIYLNAECILEDHYFRGDSLPEARRSFRDNPWKYIREIVQHIDPYIGLLSEACLKFGVKGINMPYACLTEEGIKAFGKFGVPISVWTVNDEAEMARLFSLGVENLTTLRVSAAKSVRKRLLDF